MGEAAKKDDEEKLIPVGPGAEGLPEAAVKDEDEPEDERLAQKADDDEPGDEEKPQAGARKKESARERRERAKKAHARDRLERDFLLKRNEDLEKRVMRIEGRTAQNETANIDQRINTIDSQIASAGRIMAEAIKKPNGAGSEEFEEALKIRDQLRDQRVELANAKKATDQHAKQVQAAHEETRREPESAKPDPRVIRNAREWASQHDWFDFQGTDEDCVIVRALDESLAGEGYDPTTEEYWDELTARVKRRLPERFKKNARTRDEDEDDVDDESEKARPKSGPKFSSGGRERPLKKGEVYVSAERKQAMKEYGVWDDVTARNRMLKKYAQWDAEIAASSNRS